MKSPHTKPHKGIAGASTQGDHYSTAVIAIAQLRRLGKPHRSSHAHRRNIRDRIEDGSAAIEERHVLMEYNAEGNRKLKAKAMTRLEAWKRNESLRGTGFAWARCESP